MADRITPVALDDMTAGEWTLAPGEIAGIEPASDDSALYVVLADRVLVVDPRTFAPRREMVVPPESVPVDHVAPGAAADRAGLREVRLLTHGQGHASMDFEPSARTEELQDRLADFIRDRVDPAEAVYRDQVGASGDPHFHPPVMEDLKAEARARGLWNLFLPDADLRRQGSATSSTPRCASSWVARRCSQEATNCSAPDTGNMELLAQVRHAVPARAVPRARCSTARSARASP